MLEMHKNSVSNSNCHADLYAEFMSSEHILELENGGHYSMDLINKLHTQIKRRAPMLETGNLFTLKEALGKEYWKKLSRQERENAHCCWCYLVDFLGWSVEYFITEDNKQYYLFNPGWAEYSCCDEF